MFCPLAPAVGRLKTNGKDARKTMFKRRPTSTDIPSRDAYSESSYVWKTIFSRIILKGNSMDLSNLVPCLTIQSRIVFQGEAAYKKIFDVGVSLKIS